MGNQLKIHQAIYGEVKSAHGCIFSTFEDAELNTFLTGFTDRPSAVPAGLEMQPYYSSIAFKNYYIFTLTFPDTTARRAGMVFTHALITQKKDIEHINNLGILFGYFYKAIPDKETALSELVVNLTTFENENNMETFPQYVLKGTQELFLGKLPILFCGESKSFTTFINAIWTGLPLSYRTKISYTAGFTTANLDTTKTIIYFQKDLSNSLRNVTYISDEDASVSEASSILETFILSRTPDNLFEAFLQELNVNLEDWGILQICAKAFNSYQRYKNLSNDALKQLVRQLAKISPSQHEGKTIKNNVVTEIKERIDSGKDINIKSLKNLPLTAFSGGESLIGKSIGSFIKTSLVNSGLFDHALVSEILMLSVTETAKNWWHNAINNALKSVIKDDLNACIANLWRVLESSKDALNAILPSIPEDKKYENILTQHIPENIDKDIAGTFAKNIQKRKWYILHANLLKTYLHVKEALRQQCKLEKEFSESNFEGTKLFLKIVTDKDLLSLSIDTGEDVLIKEYAKRIVKQPELLSALDVKNQVWLEIWENSLLHTKDLSHGVINLSEKLDEILDSISTGAIVPNEITNQIANSQYADLTERKNRSDIWKFLPPGAKNLFLDATANGLIANSVSHGLSGAIIESELKHYISEDKYITSVLKTYRSEIDVILNVFEHITNIKDSFFADYIKYYPDSISELQSARLGNLIVSKHLTRSAREIFEKAKHNKSFKIALTKCHPLANLGFWDKLTWGGLIGEAVSPNSVYAELTRIAIKLYDKGPDDQEIWKRAGGDVSRLHQYKSREENWVSAIDLLKKGGGGKNISVNTLIKEMREDHPNNTELKEIKKYFT